MKETSLRLRRRLLRSSVALIMMASLFVLNSGFSVDATTSNVKGTISVSPESIEYGQTTTVTMNLTGQAGITQNPVDVMLVLDRSGSMGSVNLQKLKVAANQFIDILDRESDGTHDGTIGNGSRIGVVAFDTNAQILLTLTDHVTNLKNAVNNIRLGDWTNQEDAFNKAQAVLAASNPDSKKIMLMFTDGEPTRGTGTSNPTVAAQYAAAAAKAARDAGTEIFTIGFGQLSSQLTGYLKDWATDPDNQHFFPAPTASDLETAFEGIGASIVIPAATNIAINNKVNSNFTVSNVSSTKGAATLVGNEIKWEILSLVSETITLTYTLTPTELANGDINVSEFITYLDDEQQNVAFSNPIVHVKGLDRVAPVTEALISGYSQNDWNNQDVNITLTATDDRSGVAKTEFRVNNGEWQTYQDSFTVAEEGENTVQYKSTDHVGNVEETKSVLVKIDKTAPTLNVSFNQSTISSKNHKLIPIIAFVDAEDIHSGIETIQLLSIESNQPDNGKGDGNTDEDIQGAELGTFDTEFSLRAERTRNESRIYTVTYKATDKAGNSVIRSEQIVVK
jgi:Mg-chelatase subunit ChlD